MLTQAVIGASDFILNNLPVVLGFLLFLILFLSIGRKTEPGKQITSRISLKIPMFRNFSVKNAAAKFSMTMSTLIVSGVPLVEALDIVANVIENRVIRAAVKGCREEVMQGIPMSEPLEASRIFPPMVTHMLKIGEETGTTEQMLDKVAEYYESEVEEATKRLTTAMEPMIIVVLAIVVGGVVGAIMMPMLSIYQNAGKA